MAHSRRSSGLRVPGWLARAVAALIAAAAVVVLLALVVRVPPAEALRAIAMGGFGSGTAWAETLKRSVPILLTGLAVGWAFRAGLFNIGAEGQLLWGALAAGWVGSALQAPAAVHLPLALAAGAAAGALWAVPAAVLKARRGVPEVVVTLLLTFVADFLTRALANGPLHDPTQQGARTAEIAGSARLPDLPGLPVHWGLVLAVGVLAAMWLVRSRGRHGFRMAAAGGNPDAARAAGIPVERVWTAVLLQSGAVAGLAGAIEVTGVHRYFQSGFSPGYGYEGIAVALLGAGHPLGTGFAAVFLGGLANGAVELEITHQVNRNLATVVQALVVLAVAVRRWPRPRFLKPPRPVGTG